MEAQKRYSGKNILFFDRDIPFPAVWTPAGKLCRIALNLGALRSEKFACYASYIAGKTF